MSTHRVRTLLRPLAALCLAFAAQAACAGGNSYNITSNGTGSWRFDGVDNPAITVIRGQTYTFQLQNVNAVHPFNINTVNTTGNGSRYNSGVTNNGATGNTAITFVVPMDAPVQLHYNCGNHAAMNGNIDVVDDPDPIFADGFEAAAARR